MEIILNGLGHLIAYKGKIVVCEVCHLKGKIEELDLRHPDAGVENFGRCLFLHCPFCKKRSRFVEETSK